MIMAMLPVGVVIWPPGAVRHGNVTMINGLQVSCVPSVAARRFDLLEGLDVDVGDDLHCARPKTWEGG